MIILDVRSPSEFKRGALPDSINVPFSKAFRVDETGNKYN
jgi:rhodanese-related sulfurtransferase